MVDTARTTAALVALFPDNTTGDISAQDQRDFAVSVGRSAYDVFNGRTYTLSETPHINYPGEAVTNGTAATRLLTSPTPQSMYGATTLYNLYVTTGWRFADIVATSFTILFDFGASVKAELVAADLTGVVDTANGVYHPVSVKLEYSDDNSSYTVFDAALTSLNDDPVAARNWACVFGAAPQAGRYWRWTIGEPSPGAGDNWVMLTRVHGYGRVIS